MLNEIRNIEVVTDFEKNLEARSYYMCITLVK